MARNMAPRFKQCRRLGVNVCGHPKAMKRAGSPAFAKRKKPTEYSKQLTEKQKLKAYYGVLERQLHHYYEKALKSDMVMHLLFSLREDLITQFTALVSVTLSVLLASLFHTDTSWLTARRLISHHTNSRSAM